MEHWISKNRLVALWLLLAASAAGIYLLANHTSTDLALADRMFDFRQGRFPYKHGFFYETVMHGYAKTLLTGIWLVMLILALLPQRLRPARLSTADQSRLRWVVALAATHSCLVVGIKHRMPHACPWDVDRYGGTLPWFPTFAAHAPQMAGHCFPAGHATSALWLSALCLFWLPHQPRKALLVALAGLYAGFLLGWIQQMRGAHFLSHTLTSLWLMCALLLCVLSFSKSPR